MISEKFSTLFYSLTGNAPFPWQEALFRRFVDDGLDLPDCCDLPTGLGKTSVIAIWLIALAIRPDRIPHRLAYVVNRRTVVDQTTDEVERLREKLLEASNVGPKHPLYELNKSLQSMCAFMDDVPLAISTLRGQFADNREWSSDPCRPAVIAGTVDMIGSRLLFGAYGAGYKTKPLMAGFLGQDVLVVHDEAHLEPAFQELLVAIQKEQANSSDSQKLHVMALSATARDSATTPFGLTTEENQIAEASPDEANYILSGLSEDKRGSLGFIRKRMRAVKRLTLCQVEDEKQLAGKLVEQALAHKDSGSAILVFARSVEVVSAVRDALSRSFKSQKNVTALTGTLRGFERDRMVEHDPVFLRFLQEKDRSQANVTPQTGTVYLVCTSAGEVGVNISADHMVCDLSTYESMAQRLGRVNRFGEQPDTRVDVVYPAAFKTDDKNRGEMETRREKTLALLRKMPLLASEPDAVKSYDASPFALSQLPADERLAAFSPEPTILPVSDILFDAWSMTSITGTLPGRPPLEPYLHGVDETYDPPQTQVAWRDEVGMITGNLLNYYMPEEMLDVYPLKPHELLRDRTDRVFEELGELAKRCPAAPVWFVKYDGSVDATKTMAYFSADNDKRDKARAAADIRYCTVLLSPKAGGLKGGMLDGSEKAPGAKADGLDVADKWGLDGQDGERKRVRLFDNDPERKSTTDGMRLRKVLDIDLSKAKEDDGDDDAEGDGSAKHWLWYVKSGVESEAASYSSSAAVALDVHIGDVAQKAQALVEKLSSRALAAEWPQISQAVVVAAKLHDLGKRRAEWQRSIGNLNSGNGEWLAKSGPENKHGIRCEGYRHEFGSLMEAAAMLEGADCGHETLAKELREMSPDMRDLALHLVAAHHGRARPHFPEDEAFDFAPHTGTNAEDVATQAAQRFGRLQRRYGRWGLAYLESLLRAADYEASKQEAVR
jgi:CRISPR-associated endonuclease/helicase Cas3